MTVSKRGYFSSADVCLQSPQLGELGVTVSRENITRLLGNEGKERRQRIYADEFIAALSLSGATIT